MKTPLTYLPPKNPPHLAPPRGAYVHVPFCRHRCGYCNFTLVAGRDDLIESYLQGLERELSSLGQPQEVDTLFFGGGTPTHLAPEQLTRLFALVKRWFPLATGYEFSVEANPIDLDEPTAEVLSQAGVNRISLGVQSFHELKLAQLERDHRAREIETAFHFSRQVARSVSLDLIFGTPGETLASWQQDLDLALALRPDHLSTYGLTFERGTQFWNRMNRGELTQLDEASEGALYQQAIRALTTAGYQHYEVSNFALAGNRCRHNESYWLGKTYFAAGPGAARYISGRRETNHRSTTTYLKRVLAGESPVAESETLGDEARARERLVFGLRRLEGIPLDQFLAETGFEIVPLGGAALQNWLTQGMLELTTSHLRLTAAGLLVSDALWPALLCG